MCPHVVVKGGGGAGGGGGGRGAGSGGDGSGGGPGSGGEGAAGGGAGAGSAGPNGHKGKGKGGCPVDFITGEMFTLPQTDFSLPGPLPLRFVRIYRTGNAGRSCGLGHGWWHEYAWRARITSNHIELLDGEGVCWTLPLIAPGAEVLCAFGRRLIRTHHKLLVTTTDGMRRTLVEHHSGSYRLVEVRDRHDNVIVLEHDESGTVGRIIDSAGRVLEREVDGDRMTWVAAAFDASGGLHRWPLVVHELDQEGDLVSVFEPGGAEWSYSYDDRHYLHEERRPDGLRYHFLYERRKAGNLWRCLETWGDFADRDILSDLGRERVPECAPATPRPRGIYHLQMAYGPDRTVEILEGDGGVHRYDGNPLGLFERYVDPKGNVLSFDYDDMGSIVEEANQDLATSTFDVDDAGLLLRHVDPLGSETTYERDERGRTVAVTDALGHRWEFRVDARSMVVGQRDPLGLESSYQYDARGLLVAAFTPDGAGYSISYDAHANPVQIVFRSGGFAQLRYDLFGNLLELVTPTGARFSYEYDANGRAIAVTGPDGRIAMERDGLGRVVQTKDPSGRVTERRFVGNAVVERHHGDGRWHRLGYDSLLRGLWVEDAAREIHWVRRDPIGLVLEQKTFSGRKLEARYSRSADLEYVEETSGGATTLERDVIGRIVRVVHDDGVTETWERDPLGRLVRAQSGESEVRFERDACGRVVREQQRVGDFHFAVEKSYDEAGRLAARRYSTGWGEQLAYSGGVSPDSRTIVEDGELRADGAFSFTYDGAGQQVSRSRGLVGDDVAIERDALGRPVSLRVSWQDGRMLRERRYEWYAQGPLRQITEDGAETCRYEVDPAGRPTAVRYDSSRAAHDEEFRYSAHGTPTSSAAEARLGPGGRVVQDGRYRYGWDDRGRLVEKHALDGSESWSFSYAGPNRLVRARADAGRVVENVYDALGRRLLQRDGDVTTQFCWDGDLPVEEIRSDGVRTRRLFVDGSLAVLAERHGQAEWHHIVTDLAGTPWLSVAPDSTLRRLDLSAFGRVLHADSGMTRLRFAGQRDDGVAGLYYQRHRYFDPGMAQFTSPDPGGLAAGPQEVGFVLNPTIWVDPFGAAPVVCFSDDPWMQQRAREAAGSPDNYVHYSELDTDRARQKIGGSKDLSVWSHGFPGFFERGASGKSIGADLKKAGYKGGGHIDLIACDGATPDSGNRSAAHDLADATGSNVTGARGMPGSKGSGKIDPFTGTIVDKDPATGAIDYSKPGGYWETVGPQNQDGMRPTPSWHETPAGMREQKPPGWDPGSAGGGTLTPDPITPAAVIPEGYGQGTPPAPVPKAAQDPGD